MRFLTRVMCPLAEEGLAHVLPMGLHELYLELPTMNSPVVLCLIAK